MQEIKFGDHLNSINDNKKNLIRDGGAPEVAEKTYIPFIVLRTLSYHPDAILIANELNAHGRAEHNVSNKMHYEYLLYGIPKRRRFARWGKATKDDSIQIIMEAYKYSYDKAREVLDLFTDADIERLKLIRETGGLAQEQKAKKAKKK